jgi:alanine-glyoxylate transaminase/serine-glyoxylate transaminase/serine-pyruvate transaminase
MSDRAIEVIKNRTVPVASWFLDMNLVMGYWGANTTRAYHHTAPINALYGLHQSLVLLEQEGLEAAWRRHMHHHMGLRAGLEAMGLTFVVPEEERLPQLNLVSVPEGVDEARVRQRLLNEFNLEIGAGLGVFAGKVWRIGLMGYASRRENVLLCVSALESVLADMGAPITQGQALSATMSALA